MTYQILTGQAAADRFEDIGPHTAVVLNALRDQLPQFRIECDPCITVHTDPDQRVTYLATVMLPYEEIDYNNEVIAEEIAITDQKSYVYDFLHWIRSKF